MYPRGDVPDIQEGVRAAISSHANRVARPRYPSEPKRSLSAIASG